MTRVPHPTTLMGQAVSLEPLEPEHIDALMAIATRQPELYRFTSTPVTAEQQTPYFEKAFADRKAGTGYPFVIRALPGREVVGTTRFNDILWPSRSCELGYTWLEPKVLGSAINAESKLLMLTFIFEDMTFNRVQINTDARNKRSQAAIRALGAAYEGTLRRHKIVKDGFLRDTMIFSIIKDEWAEVKEALERRVAEKGS